jgi:uncharacterized protein (TIGR03083 family)
VARRRYGVIVTLRREEAVPGTLAELEAFEALVRSLDAAELDTATRCAGWSAGDVAAHVIGQLADITAGNFDGLGTPEVTERQVVERRGRTAAELADEMAGARAMAVAILDTFDDAAWDLPGPAGGGTLGDGVEALWFDASLHADDIRTAIGRPSELGTATRASISHIAQILTDQGYAGATIALDGVEAFPVSGGGPEINGPCDEFVLVATGRAAPARLGLDESVNIYR